MAPAVISNTNNSIHSNSSVAPSNVAAANIAASLAASAQQNLFLNLPMGGQLQVVQQSPILQIKEEPNTE